MTKRLFVPLLALAALLLPATLRADNLTAADGTATNSYLPLYGYWSDEAQHNQMIYPASMLAEANGQNLLQITFFVQSPTSRSMDQTVSIRLLEVSDSLFGSNSLADVSAASLVYTGTPVIADGEMVLEFEEGFPYQGGHLLVDWQSTSGSYFSTSFYGVSTTGNSSLYQYSSYSANVQSFLPKMAVDFSAGTLCRKPTNLAFNPTTMTATWNGGEASQWAYWLNGELLDDQLDDSTATVDSYDANTLYTLEVATVCGDDTSRRVSTSFRTPCAGDACELAIAASSSAKLNVWQDEKLVATVSGNQSLTVCSGESLAILVGTASGNVTLTDAADIELFNGSIASRPVGDTLYSNAEACPSCFPPTGLTTSGLSAHGATFSWLPIEGASYVVKIDGVEIDDNPVADTFYSFTGLGANTHYTVSVATLCDDGAPSNFRSYSFTTDCGEVTLPYYQTFEDLGFTASNGLIVPCWIRNFTSTTSDGRTFPCGSASGSNATMGFAGNENEVIFICTDEIPVNGDSLFVSFDVEMNGSAHFWCGVMTNPADSTTFIPIGSGVHSACSWHNVVFSTVGLDPDLTYRVAFKYVAPDGFTGNWVNIDNVLIRANNGCAEVSEFRVDSVAATEAVLDWTVNGSESQWLLVVNADSTVVSEHPYTLEVQPNTAYTVTLAALCATGDTTLFAAPVSFRTPCAEGVGICQVQVSSDYYTDVELLQNGSSYGTGLSGVIGVCSDSPISFVATANSSYGSNTNVTVTSVAADIELYNGAPTMGDTVLLGMPCPSCMPVTGFAASDITADGATVSWTAGSEETQWVVYLDGEEQAATSASATFSGLAANTAYTVGVRALCGDEDTSVLRTFQFRTACSGGNCDFTVEARDSYGDGWNGAAIQAYQNGSLVESLTLANSSSSQTFNVSHCLGDSIVLRWHSGSYDGECGFTILASSGDTVLNINSTSSTAPMTEGMAIAAFDEDCAGTALMQGNDPVNPGTGCNAPVNLAASAITQTGATITWNPGSTGDDFWQVDFEGEIENVESTTYTLTDLEPGTQYTISVSTICDDYDYSDAATITFTTLASGQTPCDAPSAVAASNVTGTSALITWTPASASDDSWQVTVGDQTATVNQTTYALLGGYAINNLTPNTTYTVSVATVCADGNTSSAATTQFTTAQVGIDNVEFGNSNFELYPNPATSEVTISVNNLEIQNSKFEIVSLSGQVVDQFEIHNSQFTIDLTSLPAGAYFVRLTSEDSTAVRKLIVR